MFVTMALLSESEVAEAPTSASRKLLKVQECARPGRTHAEGLWEKPPLQAGAAFKDKGRGTEGSFWPASLLPGEGRSDSVGSLAHLGDTKTKKIFLKKSY